MPRSIEECAWNRVCGNATIIPSEDIESVVSSWNDLAFQIKPKLELGIRLAPIMVRETITLLNEFLPLEHTKKDGGPDLTVVKFSIVGLALRKYFHLVPGMDGYWRYVRGIIEVFKKVIGGFEAPYKIELDNFSGRFERFNAFVKGKSKIQAPVSQIRATFGFEDEYGHIEYNGIGSVGRIYFSYGYLFAPTTKSDGVARTLVHEMSHRSAMTQDILYKVDSFAKTNNAEYEEQEKIRMPGRTKPLMPMTGFAASKDDAELAIIPDVRYLENADSYAWTARRLWKAMGRPTTD